MMTELEEATSPTRCRYCEQEAVDLVDVYEHPALHRQPQLAVPMCGACLSGAEEAGCAVYPAGAEPHLCWPHRNP